MMLIADKLIGHIVPVRFALFDFVGGIGLLIHMSVLARSVLLFRSGRKSLGHQQGVIDASGSHQKMRPNHLIAPYDVDISIITDIMSSQMQNVNLHLGKLSWPLPTEISESHDHRYQQFERK